MDETGCIKPPRRTVLLFYFLVWIGLIGVDGSGRAPATGKGNPAAYLWAGLGCGGCMGVVLGS